MTSETPKLVCMSSPRPTLVQRFLVFLRSGAVGILATVCDLGSLALMVRVFGWTPEASNIPSLFLGMVVMFVGNKYFAFQDRSPEVVKQGGKFLAIEIVGIALNALFFHLMVTLTPLADWPELARLIGTNVTYLGFSYPLWCLFVFRYRHAEPVAVPAANDQADKLAACPTEGRAP
jgi:putative flippase GtrA